VVVGALFERSVWPADKNPAVRNSICVSGL
jgi:hypothetical protein